MAPSLSPFRVAGHEARFLTLSGGWARSPLSHPFGWLGMKPAFSPFRVAGHEARFLTLSGGWARSPLSHPFGWLGTKPAFSPFRVAGHEARFLTLSGGWARSPLSLNELRFSISETPAETELKVEIFGAPRPAGQGTRRPNSW